MLLLYIFICAEETENMSCILAWASFMTQYFHAFWNAPRAVKGGDPASQLHLAGSIRFGHISVMFLEQFQVYFLSSGRHVCGSVCFLFMLKIAVKMVNRVLSLSFACGHVLRAPPEIYSRDGLPVRVTFSFVKAQCFHKYRADIPAW